MSMGGKFVVYTVFKSVDKSSKGIQKIGAVATKASLAIGAIGGAALVTAAKYERSLSVLKSVSSSTQDEMSKLNDKARELGRSTEQNPIQISDAMTELSRNGMKFKEIMGAIEPLVKGSIANNADLSQTTELLVSTLKTFNLDASKSTEVMDTISWVSKNSAANVERLADGMQYASTQAKVFGTDYKKTMLMIGYMNTLGIKGSRAGTQVKNIHTHLIKNMKKLKKYGIDVGEMVGGERKIKKILPLLKEIGQKFNSFADPEKMDAYRRLFGAIAGGGGSKLADDLSKSDSALNKLIGNMKEAEGTTKSMYDIMTDNTTGNFRKMTSALTDLAIEINQGGMLNTAAELIGKVTEFVKYLGSMKDPQKQFLLGLGKQLLVFTAIAKVVGGILATMRTINDLRAFGTVANGLAGGGAGLGGGAGGQGKGLRANRMAQANALKQKRAMNIAGTVALAPATIMALGQIWEFGVKAFEQKKAEIEAAKRIAFFQNQKKNQWEFLKLAGGTGKLNGTTKNQFIYGEGRGSQMDADAQENPFMANKLGMNYESSTKAAFIKALEKHKTVVNVNVGGGQPPVSYESSGMGDTFPGDTFPGLGVTY